MANFIFNNVTGSLVTANGSKNAILETWLAADCDALAASVGNTDVDTPDIELDDDDTYLALLAQAEADSVYDISALPAPIQTDAAYALEELNSQEWEAMDLSAFLTLADKVGPTYAVASQAELDALLPVAAPGFSIINYGAVTLDAVTRAATQKLNDRDTAYILAEAGNADVTGEIYDVADQAEADAIINRFFAMIKKKK